MTVPSLYPIFLKAVDAGTVNVVEAIVVTLEPDRIIEVVLEKDIVIEDGIDAQAEPGVQVAIDPGISVVIEDEIGGPKNIFTDDFDVDFD